MRGQGLIFISLNLSNIIVATMCDSEVMVLEAIVLRVEVMRLLINRMLPYLLLLEAYAHGSDSFIVVICVCCHNCVYSHLQEKHYKANLHEQHIRSLSCHSHALVSCCCLW